MGIRKKVITVSFVLITMVFILCLTGCNGGDDPVDLQDHDYSIVTLDYADLYYNYPESFYRAIDPFNYVADENGVILAQYLDLWYYNPVTLCLRGINFFDRFMNIPDSIYLDYAYLHRDTLISLMDDNGYFEYRMNYHHKDIYFWNPWYSGMAQGLALSFLSRLAYFTQDELSAEVAEKVFKTLDPLDPVSDEVVDIDSNGYAWIEEYPGNPPDRTFNGFMHAIIGIYDYYHLLSPNEETRKVLSAYLTTTHDHMAEFRNPGGISYYCLRHHHLDRTYHKIHVRQLDLFTNMTADSSFALFADTLETDYWEW